MRYGSGNYEAFARPRKPEGADNKTAWFVGSGLAALAGAAFLIRDAHMAGDKITILEELNGPTPFVTPLFRNPLARAPANRLS
jgi:oleate hydratase